MSFFMGFATGLAKSVDTQLKESIERTRDNIDMVSKWRLKKAEQREIERRSKDKEIEKMIKDAAYVISGDQNNINAQNIAASLYEERGLSGFNEDIEFMREQSKKGIRPLDFINRANKDLPVRQYSPSEIIRSLSDAESSYASSDMVFPKGTITPSGIISKIVPGFDVMQAGQERATQQMQQIGMATTPVAPSLSFDRYTFDREGLGYATKSVNEKLTYLRNIMDDPSSDPETATLAGQRLDELLNKSMTGEEKSAIQAINLKLSRLSTQDTSAMTEMQFKAFDGEQDALIKRRQGLEDTIALRDAKTEKEKLAIEANIAFREGRIEDGFRLTAQAEDYGTQATNATLINRVKSRAARLQGNEDYMNSTGQYVNDGFAEDRTRIKVIQANEEALMGVSFDKVQAFSTQIRQAALAEFKAKNPDLYKELLPNLKRSDDGTIDAAAAINALKGLGGQASERYNEVLNSVIQRYKTVGAKYNVSEDVIDSAAMLLTGKGLPAVTGDAAGTGTGQTDAAFSLDPTVPGPELDFDMPTDEVMEAEMAAAPFTLKPEEKLATENLYPNNSESAAKMVADALSDGETTDYILYMAGQIHDPAFSNLVSEEINKIQNAAATVAKENSVGDITTADKTVILSGVNKSKAVEKLANEQQISSEAASSLLEDAIEKINAPIRMKEDQASPENIMEVLDKEGLIALGGGVAPMRYRKAILAVADAFNMNPADAEGALDSALNIQRQQRRADAPETFEEKMERLNPDVILSEDPIERLFKGRPSFGADDVPYRKVGDEFFRINDDGTLDEKPASPAIARELQKRLSSQEATGDERSDSLLFDRDQMKRGLMYPLEMFGARVDDDAPGVPVSLFGNKSEEGEQDNRKARDLVVPSERTSPENRMRGASNAALIAAYISEDMSDLERKEIRRRLETDKSFVDQLAAVLDRVNKRKKGQDSKLTPEQLKALSARASKQQVPMARGGLMGR